MTVVPVPRSLTKVVVTLSGLSYMSNAASSAGTARVFVEKRDPTKGAADELGWEQVAGAHTLDPLQTQNPIFAIWQGTITLPGPRTPGKFRLVVEQFEIHRVQKAGDTPNLIVPQFGSKLVYSDIVPL